MLSRLSWCKGAPGNSALRPDAGEVPEQSAEHIDLKGITMTKTLYAEFTVKPGSEARVAEMMLELTEHVRREPGNELFLPYRREENPREYFVFEVYSDEAAFQKHIGADYGARFNEELARHIEGDGSALTWLLPVE
jgi:quinol monooxygenase YgiN